MKLFMKLLAVVFIVGSAAADAALVIKWEGKVFNCAGSTYLLSEQSARTGVCWTTYGACKSSAWITGENCGVIQERCEGHDKSVKGLARQIKDVCH